MGRRWNSTLNYYENKPKHVKGQKVRLDWIKEARPTETKELTEEIFSHILLQVRKANYKNETLSQDRLDEEIAKETMGASDLRDKSKFGEWVSPVVYQRMRKVEGKKVYTNHLRIVDAFQRDNNYQTFILKALWDYDVDEGQALMRKYETKLKKGKLWDKYGWSKEPPPKKPSRTKRYDLDGYIELLMKMEEEAEEKITEKALAKTAK